MSFKLFGSIVSPAVQEILHLAEVLGISLTVEEHKNNIFPNTCTLPCLSTPQGLLSESKAIEYFLASKKPQFIGKSAFEKAQIRMWFELAEQFNVCGEEIYYPIFGWREYNKDSYEVAEGKVLILLKALDSQLNGKKYVNGNNISIADIALFRALKFYFQLVFPEAKRKNLFNNVNTWFSTIYSTKEAQHVYGPFALCRVPVKPSNVHIEYSKYLKGNKPCSEPCKQKCTNKVPGQCNELTKFDNPCHWEKSEKRIKEAKEKLDSLPKSKFDLAKFKTELLKSSSKKEYLANFFNNFDNQGYSIYFLQYQNLPTDGKIIYLTKTAMSFFVEKLNNVKDYIFGNMGVYGCEGDLKIRGVIVFRGSEVPELVKEENDLLQYYTLTRLDASKDRKKIEEYWTKNEEDEEVEERPVKCFTYVG